MFIRSERLFLRPGWTEDCDELLRLIADEQIVRNLAAAPWPYTRDDAETFLGLRQARLLPNFLITRPSASGSEIVGNIGFGRNGDDVEVGYWIGRQHWGKGYATEALRSVLKLARALGHRRLVAGHFVDNPASGRVLTKAGFSPKGKSLRHSMARSEDVMSIDYAISLDPCNSDAGNEADDGMAVKRAA